MATPCKTLDLGGSTFYRIVFFESPWWWIVNHSLSFSSFQWFQLWISWVDFTSLVVGVLGVGGFKSAGVEIGFFGLPRVEIGIFGLVVVRY